MIALIYLSLICSFWAGQVIAGPANPYLVIIVSQGQGPISEAQSWSDHSQDTIFETGTYSLDRPWVAFDWGADKYTTLGQDEKGGWTAYVWAGYHMVVDSSYDLSIQVFGPSQVICSKPDGSEVFRTMLGTGGTWSWTLSAQPATASQWRTKGYKLAISPVPEPSSVMILAGLMIGFAGLYWRKL
ncbi:MAG: hypothetical protein US31_C0002G0071 [Berkelbacteria bacterium GW2011_GWA1_36_9]|uniref:Ice-binding protein C-terminal domain-containing protein n=1 Tax=Berkelbacteria bacterium GW2011_GWA1_36_9 TaxID=1618331 RepID=A0A0G0IRU9_9BACT|nr:MAG: hypothetical protein US31_C0002G0071 [Berkelbacteria bacterium GW2011_GWA1_36_9]